jgi:hypothetical protein
MTGLGKLLCNKRPLASGSFGPSTLLRLRKAPYRNSLVEWLCRAYSVEKPR